MSEANCGEGGGVAEILRSKIICDRIPPSFAIFPPFWYYLATLNIKDMSQDRLVILKNKKTGSTIFTTKNKKTNPKLKMKKYDPVTRKKEDFVEVKK